MAFPRLHADHRTWRRRLLDEALSRVQYSGKVLDVGGKKGNQRGQFRPPLDQVTCWHYVNLDERTPCDVAASADLLPFAGQSYDLVMLAEVLEHLRYPEKALAECARVLVPGGRLICASPFLFPVHADPFDFQRWTAEKYHQTLQELGFSEVSAQPMGGLFAVLYDLISVSLGMAARDRDAAWNRRMRHWVLPLLDRFCTRYERRCPHFARQGITTGYFVVAVKR